MPDMTITNQTNNQYAFGPYVLPPGIGTGTVTIDTTTNASLYLTDDAFADIVNALYVASPQLITVTNQPTPFPRVTGTPQIVHGDGSPEGVVFATSGSLFMRRDNGGATSALYAKTSGPSLSTGWGVFAGSPTPATTLPSSPANGQQAILVDSTSAPTYSWLLQYVSSASKWVYLGGASLFNEVLTGQTQANSGYGDLATVGPTVTVPRAGDYFVEIGATAQGTGVNVSGEMSYQVGATAPVDSDGVVYVVPSGGTNTNLQVSGERTTKKTGLAASTAITAKYRNTSAGNSISWANRWMRVTPIVVT